MEPTWLSKAPIVEALVDIQVVPKSEATVQDLERFEQQVKAQYPNRTSRLRFESQITATGDVTNKSSIDGYFHASIDGKQIAQARVGGFAFSRLAPYVPWEEWVKEAKTVWLEYKTIVEPTAIGRIAVRTINAIKIESGKELSEFLRIYPEIAKDQNLPQGFAGYFMRLLMFDAPGKAWTVISQSVDPPTPGNAPVVSLDIEVFRENLGAIGEDEIWAQLEELRAVKNRIFFATVTSKIIEDCK